MNTLYAIFLMISKLVKTNVNSIKLKAYKRLSTLKTNKNRCLHNILHLQSNSYK